MTDDDYDALSQKQLASIKRDMRISLEDAAVRATYKVMAELETEQTQGKEHMTHEEQIAKLTEMLEIQQKLHEKAIDMLKPAIEIAVQKEREACAKIADEWAVGWPHPSEVIAERIRARGQA